jgi:acetyl-CoA acetyltransferase
VGAEKLSHPDKQRSFDAIGRAVDLEEVDRLRAELYGTDAPAGTGTLFMDVYASLTRRYMRDSGATAADFATVAVKNRRHGHLNPRAQYRDLMSVGDVLQSRMISDPLTLLMCSPIGDGAAALLVSTDAAARTEGAVRVLASSVVSGSDDDPRPAAERAARAAYEQAGLGPDDLDLAEVHDAAAPAEMIIYEELGLAAVGEAPKLLASGATALGGRVPVNVSGGLLSKGHPVGATGCAQLVELTEQLRGRAGQRQVDGARIGLAENAGGYLGPDQAVAAVTVLGR